MRVPYLLLEWSKMRSHACSILVVLGLAFCLAEELNEGGNVPSVRLDGSRRPLIDVGYLRYGNPFLQFGNTGENIQNPNPQNPTETNEIGREEERRPFFLIRTLEPFRNPIQQQTASNESELIGIRKKRDAESDIPESSKVGKLRKKRTYCHKCGGGGGGYGGYSYRPVTYAVYPVYTYPVSYGGYGGYGGGGGGKGCNVCGGHGGGGGGGFSGSYSQSSSMSSSGSWGYGK